MRPRSITVVMLAVSLLLTILAAHAAALTVEEAKKEFEARCKSCHNGNLAPDFQGTIRKIEEWASKYKTLDEAVKNEAKTFKMFRNAKTWKELMSVMPGITPDLEKFFEEVFEKAKAGGGAAPAATTTTTTPTPTPTPTKRTPTVTIIELNKTLAITPAGHEEGTYEHIKSALYASFALVAVAAAIIGYVWFRH